ncbi:MAG: 5'-methylthioadenosine/S-adenosylhomocysteine nucleosidase [Clostridia bacterium]|nr:5'-methylthioadenosine/S-adenosylhomocysteine nucleosidase [Clostridia bacterium]
MRIGIICAGDREVAPFLPLIEDDHITEKAMLTFHEGAIRGVPAVCLYSGVCKVNAAIATQILIDTFHVDAVINAGTAGGMDERLQIFDTVICTEAAYHDVAPDLLTEFHPWLENQFFQADPELLQLARTAATEAAAAGHVYFGRMVTGEAFITDEGRQRINEGYAPLSVDMETAAIAHVCYVNRIPFLAIRTITDTPSHSGAAHFEENCLRASAIARDITAALLAGLCSKV